MNEAETWIVENQRWFFHVARQYRSNPHLVEELAQEGALEALKAASRWDGRGDVTGWIRENARLSIKRAAFPSSARGAYRDVVEKPFDVQSTIDLEGLWEDVYDDYSKIYMRVHAVEVQEAILELSESERRYVVRKFYDGATTHELQMEFGLGCHGLWKRARLKLRQRLAHLEGLV